MKMRKLALIRSTNVGHITHNLTQTALHIFAVFLPISQIMKIFNII